MAQITLKGSPVQTCGDLPAVGSAAPAFSLTKTDLSEIGLSDLSGKTVVLNIFPSIDTPTCQASTRRFNQDAAGKDGVVVICASADLPFALGRFCSAEGLEGVVPTSNFRAPAFGGDYGVTIIDGPLRGLCARAVVVIDGTGTVLHTELVPEIADEPNYEAALAVI